MDFIKKGFGTKTKEYDFLNKKTESVDEVMISLLFLNILTFFQRSIALLNQQQIEE